MKKLHTALRATTIVLGIVSSLSFMISFYILGYLRPKMIRFEEVPGSQLDLMNIIGFGLVIFFVFCLLSLFRIISSIKNSERMSASSISLVVVGILSLLCVFSDIALLGDIVKQFKYGLSQPEWSLVFPIMSFQFIIALVFLYTHLFKIKTHGRQSNVTHDSNIFLITQYTGVICGFLGLLSSFMGFIFPCAWKLNVHTTPSIIILLFPYALALLFWFIIKIKEKSVQFFDEKQILDIGKSAFWTMIITVIFMTVLFVGNYNNLHGVVSILWFPVILFCILFFFSLGTLYFTRRD